MTSSLANITPYNGPDTISGQLLTALIGFSTDYIGIEARLAAADGDKEKAIAAFLETSDDSQIVKLRNAISAAREKMLAIANEKVVVEVLSEDEKARLEKEKAELTTRIRSGRKTIADLSVNFGTDPTGVAEALESIPDPTKSGKGRKAGTTGSSLPRVSATLSVTGGNLTNEKYESFSALAAVLNVDVADIQKPFADAAGVDPADIKSAFNNTNVVTFSFKPHEAGNEYTVVATQKVRAKRGSKVAGKTEESATEASEESNTEETSGE